MSAPLFDLAIIGGGVNGAAVARDAAGRGLKVLLVEKDDLASHTSSASTKLIHGGLRYLEFYEFRLVREALQEREIILKIAPHLTRPLRFVLPHEKSHRPAWMIRIGLFLYDHLARRETLPGTEMIDLRRHRIGQDIRADLAKAFLYSDGWVDDARLVVLTARDAADRGADIRTRTRLDKAERQNGVWSLEIKSGLAPSETVTARCLVNAAGPWVGDVLRHRLGIASSEDVRLVKGSHIVVPSLYEGAHAFIFQNSDGRIVFAIPYEETFTLIGTTDIPFTGDPGAPRAEESEISYLCGSVNAYFRKAITPGDVVWSYSGVRPLFDDGHGKASEISRDYVLKLDESDGKAPVLSVFGGKITTHRELAVRVMDRLKPFFPSMSGEWTGAAPLPGGDMPRRDLDAFVAAAERRWPFLDKRTAHRLARAYGTRMERILGNARTADGLGRVFGCGFSEAELAYLVREEWARTAEDILWRRSKLGLHLPRPAMDEISAALETLAAKSPA